jgi:hypothetical protein
MWNYLPGVKYEMENEKDLSDSGIESDLEEECLANFLTFLETEYLLC